MEVHPLASTMPEMTAEEYEGLKRNIGAVGLLVPIVRFEGKILDGRHRYRACEEIGVPPLRFVDFEGTREQAALAVEGYNLDRRNLTPSAKREARVALEFEMSARGMSTHAIAEVVGVHQATVVRDLKRGDASASPPPIPAQPEGSRLAKVQELKANGHTDEEVAKALNVSTKTIQRDKVDIAEKAKEAAPRVEGRDGKKYPAKRTEAKVASKPRDRAESSGVGYRGSTRAGRSSSFTALLMARTTYRYVPTMRMIPASTFAASVALKMTSQDGPTG